MTTYRSKNQLGLFDSLGVKPIESRFRESEILKKQKQEYLKRLDKSGKQLRWHEFKVTKKNNGKGRPTPLNKLNIIVAKTTVVNKIYEVHDVNITDYSKWDNPFRIGIHGNREECLNLYRQMILGRPDLLRDLKELIGLRLGCICYPHPCHGDILVELIKQIYRA